VEALADRGTARRRSPTLQRALTQPGKREGGPATPSLDWLHDFMDGTNMRICRRAEIAGVTMAVCNGGAPSLGAKGTHTWRVTKMSTRTEALLLSDTFTVGGVSWRMVLYPKGCKEAEGSHLSLFIWMVDDDKPYGWTCPASVTLVVKSQTPNGNNGNNGGAGCGSGGGGFAGFNRYQQQQQQQRGPCSNCGLPGHVTRDCKGGGGRGSISHEFTHYFNPRMGSHGRFEVRSKTYQAICTRLWVPKYTRQGVRSVST
jgi:hypothetical protein